MKKFTKKALLALLLGMTSALAVHASAEDPAGTIDAPVYENMERIVVTSSDSSVPGSSDKIETAYLFDGLSSTGCTVNFIEIEPGTEGDLSAGAEIADAKVLSVYTASRTPEALRKIAGLFDGDKGTILGISVYATNDSLLLDWTRLHIVTPLSKDGEYDIIDINEDPVKYSFYRIDIELVDGDTFTLSELLLYKEADGMISYYESDGEVEAGTTPTLVQIPAEEPAEETPEDKRQNFPQFGLFGMPGAFRPAAPNR